MLGIKILLLLSSLYVTNKIYKCGDNFDNNGYIYVCIHNVKNKKKTSFKLLLNNEKLIVVKGMDFTSEHFIVQTSNYKDLKLPLFKEDEQDKNWLHHFNYWNIVLIYDKGKLLKITAKLDCKNCEKKDCINIGDKEENKNCFYSSFKNDKNYKENNESNSNLILNFTFLGINEKEKLISYENIDMIDKDYVNNLVKQVNEQTM